MKATKEVLLSLFKITGVRRCATSYFDPGGEVVIGAEAQTHRRCGGGADP